MVILSRETRERESERAEGGGGGDGRRNGQDYTRTLRITRAITPWKIRLTAPRRPFYDPTFIRHFEPLNVRCGISSLIYRDVNSPSLPPVARPPLLPHPPRSSCYMFADTIGEREILRGYSVIWDTKEMCHDDRIASLKCRILQEERSIL